MNLFDIIVESGNSFEAMFIAFVVLVASSILLGTLCNYEKNTSDKKFILKSIIYYVIFAIGTIFIFGLATYITPQSNENRYYLPAELYAVKPNNSTWIFIDYDGNTWEWEDSTRTYSDDTVYLLNMEANMTFDDITDDIILMVWDEGGEETTYG